MPIEIQHGDAVYEFPDTMPMEQVRSHMFRVAMKDKAPELFREPTFDNPTAEIATRPQINAAPGWAPAVNLANSFAATGQQIDQAISPVAEMFGQNLADNYIREGVAPIARGAVRATGTVGNALGNTQDKLNELSANLIDRMLGSNIRELQMQSGFGPQNVAGNVEATQQVMNQVAPAPQTGIGQTIEELSKQGVQSVPGMMALGPLQIPGRVGGYIATKAGPFIGPLASRVMGGATAAAVEGSKFGIAAGTPESLATGSPAPVVEGAVAPVRDLGTLGYKVATGSLGDTTPQEWANAIFTTLGAGKGVMDYRALLGKVRNLSNFMMDAKPETIYAVREHMVGMAQAGDQNAALALREIDAAIAKRFQKIEPQGRLAAPDDALGTPTQPVGPVEVPPRAPITDAPMPVRDPQASIQSLAPRPIMESPAANAEPQTALPATGETQAAQVSPVQSSPTPPRTAQAPAAADAVDTPSPSEQETKTQSFSRKEIESRLIDWADRTGMPSTAGDSLPTDEAAYELNQQGFSMDFPGKLPSEITNRYEKQPHILNKFRTNVLGGKGPDSLSDLGDRYFQFVEQSAAGKAGQLRNAIASAKASPDPEARFLAWMHERLNETPKAERTKKQIVNPDSLEPGQAFTIEGEPFEVILDENDTKVLRDGKIEVPAWAMDRIPIDKGSVKDAAPYDGGDFVPPVEPQHTKLPGVQLGLTPEMDGGMQGSQMDMFQPVPGVDMAAPQGKSAIDRETEAMQNRTQDTETGNMFDGGASKVLGDAKPDSSSAFNHIVSESEPYRALDLTRENWVAEFGESQRVKTPLGMVKLGQHQFEKLSNRGRDQFFGLIKPTLERPSLIVQSSDGAIQYLKAFKNERGHTFFLSVSRAFDGTDVVITNHPKRPTQIKKIVETGRLLYSTALNAPEGTLPKQPTNLDDSASSINRDQKQVKQNSPDDAGQEPRTMMPASAGKRAILQAIAEGRPVDPEAIKNDKDVRRAWEQKQAESSSAMAIPGKKSTANSAPNPRPSTASGPPGPTTPTQQTTSQSLNKLGQIANILTKAMAPTMRSADARKMGDIIREHAAHAALNYEQANHQLKGIAKAFDAMKPSERLDFIDRMENGSQQPTPQLAEAARSLRELLDGRRQEIQALGTGKLKSFILNYFPHIWADPEQAQGIISAIMGKRPLEGTKSFLKKRSVPTIADGLAMGLTPVSDNPVELTLLKLREMDRYLMGQRILGEMKDKSLTRYVPIFDKGPEGWSRIDDKIAIVHGPPHVVVHEAYDKMVRDQLTEILDDLGVDHERLNAVKAGGVKGRAWGVAQGTDTIQTRFAGPDSVLMHELGHILDNRHGLFRKIVDNTPAGRKAGQEMIDLAKLRHEGQNPDPSYQQYVQKPEEQIANAVMALLYAPERLHQVAPTVEARLKGFLQGDPILSKLLDIKPSLVLDSAEGKVPVGGMVTRGQYWAPEPVAHVLNQYLSPGLTGNPMFDLWRGTGNALNQAQLGFSAFHLAFTALDSVTSKTSLGIYQMAYGHPIRGALNVAKTPIGPLLNYLQGSRVLREALAPGTVGGDMARMVNALEAAGGRVRMDSFYRNSSSAKFLEALRKTRESYVPQPGLLHAIPSLFELAAHPVMEHLVPRMKLGIFADMARYELQRLGPNAGRDEVRATMRKVWDSVDNRMGQMVYDNLFWHRVTKDLAMASVRSVGWNLGTIRELGGGVLDTSKAGASLLQGKRPEFTHRMAYVVALPAVAAVAGSIVHYLYNGKSPESLKDAIFPRTGRKLADGTEERLSLPTYMKDVYAYAKHPLTTLEHKAHPLISTVLEMLHNEDYYGNQIRNPDDSAVQQVQQVGQRLLEQYTPFSVRNAMESKRRDDGMSQKIGGFVGLTLAPKELSRTKAQQMMHEYFASHGGAGLTPEEAELAGVRRDLREKMRLPGAEGKRAQSELLDLVRDRKITIASAKKLLQDASENPNLTAFKRLPVEVAERVYAAGTEEEKKQWKPYLMLKRGRAGRIPAAS